MKKLILVRHAKSSWEHNVTDHERPLNKRGFSDANLVSNSLKNKSISLDFVLSSDAVRAKTTAEIFMVTLNIDKRIFKLNYNLYDFSGSELVKVISGCEDEINNLMVFGHNHAITAFVNAYGDKYIGNVPTCGVTMIEFEIDSWKDLKPGKTVLSVFPRDLKN